MKMCAGNLKIVQRCSSAVFWFECVYVRDFDEDSEDLFIFYNSIDKERIKKHFCSSGSSGDTQGYTKANQITTEDVFLESSEIFRESPCRGIGGNVAKKLKRKRYFLWFF